MKREIAKIYKLVVDYFNGDVQKTTLWFQAKNPTLGGISPRDMIQLGRYKKLEKFVLNALKYKHMREIKFRIKYDEL